MSNLRNIIHGTTVVAVCDGHVIGKGSTESCEDCLRSLMDVHSVTVYPDYAEYMGRYGSLPMYVIGKHKNAGKRDSQLRVFRLVNEGRFGQVDCIFLADAVRAMKISTTVSYGILEYFDDNDAFHRAAILMGSDLVIH